MTINELIDALENLPVDKRYTQVLVDGYEDGYDVAEGPFIFKAVRVEGKPRYYGPWEKDGGEMSQRVVVISRQSEAP